MDVQLTSYRFSIFFIIVQVVFALSLPIRIGVNNSKDLEIAINKKSYTSLLLYNYFNDKYRRIWFRTEKDFRNKAIFLDSQRIKSPWPQRRYYLNSIF